MFDGPALHGYAGKPNSKGLSERRRRINSVKGQSRLKQCRRYWHTVSAAKVQYGGATWERFGPRANGIDTNGGRVPHGHELVRYTFVAMGWISVQHAVLAGSSR